MGGTRRRLRIISEIRTFVRSNETPIVFLGPTPFNLLGLDRWVRNFSYVAYYDSWEGAHPRVFAPKEEHYTEFQSAEEINNYLLRHPDVQEFIARRGNGQAPKVASRAATTFTSRRSSSRPCRRRFSSSPATAAIWA